MLYLDEMPPAEDLELKQPNRDTILRRQKAFSYTYEDLNVILEPMAKSGKEAMGSMGNDNPLAVLSDRPVHLAHYFKQLFAQVTNPPIDPIRERIVMDLRTYIGGFKNLLSEEPRNCRRIAISQPVLTNLQLTTLDYVDKKHFQTKKISTVFNADGKPGRLETKLDRICKNVEFAIDEGYSIILLTDFQISSDHAAIPSLLAAAAVHHHLIRIGKRGKVDIIVEAGDVRETHHFATLLGYGVSAINPYMALDSIRQMVLDGELGDITPEQAQANYVKAIGNGLLKIFSKMGISTLQSYQGAQIFEIVRIK